MKARRARGLSLAVEARTLGSLWSRQLGGGGGGDMGCAILAAPAPSAAAVEAEILAWGCARSLWVFTSSSSERAPDAPTTASAVEPSAATDEVAAAASDDCTGNAALARARREKRERKQAKRRRRNAQRDGSAAGGEGGAGEEGAVDVRDVLPGPTRPDARIDVHAEQDAVSDAAKRGKSLRGSTAYVTSAPCRTCFALLLNAGVASIVCGDTLERYTSPMHAQRMRGLARFYGVALSENAAVPPYAGLTERRLRRDGMPS